MMIHIIYGVCVYCICPNYIESQLLRELFTVAIGGALKLDMYTLYVGRYHRQVRVCTLQKTLTPCGESLPILEGTDSKHHHRSHKQNSSKETTIL